MRFTADSHVTRLRLRYQPGRSPRGMGGASAAQLIQQDDLAVHQRIHSWSREYAVRDRINAREPLDVEGAIFRVERLTHLGAVPPAVSIGVLCR